MTGPEFAALYPKWLKDHRFVTKHIRTPTHTLTPHGNISQHVKLVMWQRILVPFKVFIWVAESQPACKVAKIAGKATPCFSNPGTITFFLTLNVIFIVLRQFLQNVPGPKVSYLGALLVHQMYNMDSMPFDLSHFLTKQLMEKGDRNNPLKKFSVQWIFPSAFVRFT